LKKEIWKWGLSNPYHKCIKVTKEVDHHYVHDFGRMTRKNTVGISKKKNLSVIATTRFGKTKAGGIYQ
jgi:hypothetical protein